MGILAIVGACITLIIGSVFTALGHPYLGVYVYALSLLCFAADIFLLNQNAGVRSGHTLFVACIIGISALFSWVIQDGWTIALKLSPIYFFVTWIFLERVRRKTKSE